MSTSELGLIVLLDGVSLREIKQRLASSGVASLSEKESVIVVHQAVHRVEQVKAGAGKSHKVMLMATIVSLAAAVTGTSFGAYHYATSKAATVTTPSTNLPLWSMP